VKPAPELLIVPLLAFALALTQPELRDVVLGRRHAYPRASAALKSLGCAQAQFRERDPDRDGPDVARDLAELRATGLFEADDPPGYDLALAASPDGESWMATATPRDPSPSRPYLATTHLGGLFLSPDRPIPLDPTGAVAPWAHPLE
jgi:hypothetical protein